MPKRAYFELGPFTVFDLETTGMSAVNDRIVEIGALRVDLDGSISRFTQLVNPNRKIPYSATQIHRITDDMVSDAPHFREIGFEFLKFAKNSTLVAHNARFDLAFLQESLSRNGLPVWQGKTLDSLTLIRKSHQGLSSYKLQFLREVFGLADHDVNNQAHRAMADVEWTHQILKIALERLLEVTER